MELELQALWGMSASPLAAVALAGFLAATLLPLSSEAVLFAVLRAQPELATAALLTATLANTLGGMTTYALGRYAARKRPLQRIETMRRWGAPALLFAWVPIVGDGLVLAAGWLRVNWAAAALFQAAGRCARYWLVVESAAF
jgi:membrane protein YqaA with SNARE-associated domain